MNDPRRQRGFTIVETLVAITILMIAIAGPLSVASKGLAAALASRDQLTASYLAQESMEYVKSLHDNNIARINGGAIGIDWLTTSGGSTVAELSSCTVANPCDATGLSDQAGYGSPILSGLATYPLYLAPNGYSHATGAGPITPFSRYFYLTQVTVDEYVVTVSVNWSEGSVPYNVTVSSTIINNTR